MNLLLLSDSPDVREFFRCHAVPVFSLIEALHEEKAIEIAQTASLFAIVIEGEADRFPLTRALRTITQGKVPLILITERLDRPFFAEAKKEGITHLLSRNLIAAELFQLFFELQEKKEHKEKVETLPLPKNPIPAGENLSLKARPLLGEQRKKLLEKGLLEESPTGFLLLQSTEIANQGFLAEQRQAISLSNKIAEALPPRSLLLPETPHRFIALMPSSSEPSLRELAFHLHRTFPLQIAYCLLEGRPGEFEKKTEEGIEALLRHTREPVHL